MKSCLIFTALFTSISLSGCAAFPLPSFAGTSAAQSTPVLSLSKRSGIYLQGVPGNDRGPNPARAVGVTAVVRYDLM